MNLQISLRQKLLLMFSLTVVVAVAAVGWTVSLRVRKVFDQIDEEQTEAFTYQFQREFEHRAHEVATALDRIAASDRLTHMAFEIAHGGDSAQYLTEASSLAGEERLSYLEITSADGSIISSAQWPARFGFPEPVIDSAGRPAFLKQEELPDGSSGLGLFAARAVYEPDAHVPAAYIVGGLSLDRDFLATLPVPANARLYLYRNSAGTYDPQSLISTDDQRPGANKFRLLIDAARTSGNDASGIVYLSARRQDSVNATAIPLKNKDGHVLAVLLISNSRAGMVEVERHIRAIAFGVAGIGILLAIGASLWIAARISAPIEQLARAAGEVAEGRWDTQVTVCTRDEVGALATSFNRMTSQLVEQREQLVQTERVAAWRELARRLAHELKNPLFPLQLTVENMVRAKRLSVAEFDEAFVEGTDTLQSEIANLKTVVARFNDFSRMPKPQEQRVDACDLLQRVLSVYALALREHTPPIALHAEIPERKLIVSADPELMHRAISNLVLNAIDAMPEGGELRATVERKDSLVQVRISDTGQGLTPEECQRLFTPYYTTKEYGTGLGLAIVQSVIADHRGAIHAESAPGVGTTFTIELALVEAA